jgi:hypothetical protein
LKRHEFIQDLLPHVLQMKREKLIQVTTTEHKCHVLAMSLLAHGNLTQYDVVMLLTLSGA